MTGTKRINWREVLFGTRTPGWSVPGSSSCRACGVFPEGIQKLIFPEILGAGRFIHFGVPSADIMGPFVGVAEIECGVLIILGLARGKFR